MIIPSSGIRPKDFFLNLDGHCSYSGNFTSRDLSQRTEDEDLEGFHRIVINKPDSERNNTDKHFIFVLKKARVAETRWLAFNGLAKSR